MIGSGLRLAWFCLFLLAANSSQAAVRSIAGVVVDTQGRPLEGAQVRYQGARETVLSGSAGRFRMPPPAGAAPRHITAWKSGYFNGGVSFKNGKYAYRIALKALPVDDNPDYRWVLSRGPVVSKKAKPCANCHTPELIPLIAEWAASGHAKAATNPFFLGFFRGDRSLLLVDGLGYRSDFPHANGNCATCHVPALALRRPYAADPSQAEGAEQEGIFCDFCHKVQDVTPDATGGRPGIWSMRLLRPAKEEQVFFGPYDDVFPGPDSFNPLYQESRYCAACHDGRFWGVQVYGEFAEWAASDYPAKKISCQSCHMKPDGKTTRIALAKEGSILRLPERIASHTFSGRENLDFMRSAVTMEAQTQLDREQGKMTVRVVLSNTGAGHHLPSGNPMRNLILLVEARDGAGRILEQMTGSRVPIWGGEGAREKGNYAGLPGKGYAKVLKTPLLYPADRSFGDTRSPLYPAPHWRQVMVESDNRLPADGEDASEYSFQMSSGPTAGQVRIRLLHRRTYRSWLTPEALPDGDLLLAEQLIRLPQ